MRQMVFLLCLLLVTAPAVARMPIGIFFRWGAFEQADEGKCYALAKADPSSPGGDGQPYASVAFQPERGGRPQFYIRLSRKKRAGSASILRIDQASFQLIGAGGNAWAPNARADAAIVAAMRTGVSMSVESRSEGGGRIRDRYQLRGAASAIDAAALACARRPR